MNITNTSSTCSAGILPPISKIDDIAAGTLVLLTASVSALVNGLSAHVAHRLTRLRGSFTQLSVSQAVGDCGVLMMYALWTAPAMYSQTSLALGLVGRKIGQLSLLFWYGSAYSMLVIAVNRYFAICWRQLYDQLFTERNTIIVIAITWLLAVAHATTFFVAGCNFFYDPRQYMWSHDRCSACGQFNMHFEVYYSGGVLMATFAFNMATVCGLYKLKQSLAGVSLTSREERRRRYRELRFFLQAVVNACIFYFMLISFNVISTWSDGKWFYFCTTTLAWEASHAANGWLFLIFNPDVRKSVGTSLFGFWTLFDLNIPSIFSTPPNPTSNV